MSATEEIREQHWQGKCLAYARGKMAAVLMSILAEQVKDAIAMKTMLETTFPGFSGIALPFYCSTGRITAMGRVVAHMIDRTGRKQYNALVFETEADMEKEFRELADELNLSDADRVALFDAARAWITVDFRLDPMTGERETVAEMQKKYRKVS